jgi:hypothetical protein
MSESDDDDYLDRVAATLPVHQFLIEVLMTNMLRDNRQSEVDAFVATLKSVFAKGEIPAGADEHHAVRIADVVMQSEAVLDRMIGRVLDRLATDESDEAADPVTLARAWVRVGFEGAREDGLDMVALAEEAMIRAIAVLLDRDVETVRGEAPALIEQATELARILLAQAARTPKQRGGAKPGRRAGTAKARRAKPASKG